MVGGFDYAAQPKESVACNLCGRTDALPIATQDRYGFAVRVVQCQGCQLRYLNPRMTAEAYARFYETAYRPLLQAYKAGKFDARAVEADQWDYAAQLANTVAGSIPQRGRLLDAGGSVGAVGRLFRARWEFDVCVVDPALDELTQARACCQHHGTLEGFAGHGTYDVIACCRTVDHLLDPVAVLKQFRQWIASSGVLLIDAMDVPQWPESRRYKVDHPYALTKYTLPRLVQAAGWRVDHVWIRKPQYVGLLCRPQE